MLVPVVEESDEVVRHDALDHFLLTETHHDVRLLVPCLADLNVAILLLNLELVLPH